MHLSNILLNAKSTDMGRQLLHEKRETCLKIGINLAIFKLYGNIPCLSDKFMICVSVGP